VIVLTETGRLRVYELAKQLDLDSRRLIDLLRRLGIEVRNHMSTLEPDAIQKVTEIVKAPPKVEEPPQDPLRASGGSPSGGTAPTQRRRSGERSSARRESGQRGAQASPSRAASQASPASGVQVTHSLPVPAGQRPAREAAIGVSSLPRPAAQGGMASGTLPKPSPARAGVGTLPQRRPAGAPPRRAGTAPQRSGARYAGNRVAAPATTTPKPGA